MTFAARLGTFGTMVYPVRAYLYSRFSTAEQRKGNSLARQHDYAKEFCLKKGIGLDEALTFTDAGVSGHKGKNHQTGALGLFLQACEQGRIARGSFLIVENLDRRSRENPLDALHLLRTLLKTHGITLVVIHPAAELTAANFDMLQGVLAFIEFSRGHSESAAKSVRSRDNWKRKLAAIKEGKLVTRKVPCWLKAVDGKLEVNEAKAKVVRQIFEWSAKGYGQQTICRLLRDKNIPAITRTPKWHESFIQKLLEGRAVLGEYQPHALDEQPDGTRARVPVGEPFKNYFPPVVSHGLWTRSRQAMAARRNVRGRISKHVNNLFTGLVFEGDVACRFTSTNFAGYLQRFDRLTPGVRYDHFERVILRFVQAVSLAGGEDDERSALERQAAKLEENIKKLKRSIDADSELADMLPTLAKWRREHAETLERLQAAAVPPQARHLHTVRLVEALATATGEERETLRREVRQTIRQVVRRIDVSVVSRRRPHVPNDADRLRLELPDPLPKTWRVVRVCVRLTTGEAHDFAYIVDGNRLAGGVHLHTTDGTNVDRIDPQDVFPSDPPTEQAVKADDLKEKCRVMRAEGKSYKDITAATGLHRVSIYRYLTGYMRPDRR